jgi:dTDP-4-dehydrorhamnose reductase
MNRLLILGGSGILGSEVVLKASKLNIDFVAPNSSDLDIRNYEEVLSVVSVFKPDWIINCAAFTNVDEAEESFDEAVLLNATAVENLAKAAAVVGSLLIHISTDYVFDGTSEIPYETSHATNPINKYGLSKQLGEAVLLDKYSGSSYVIRTSWLYGVNGKNFVKTLCGKALKSESAQVVGDQVGNPTSARDLATGIFELIEKKPSPGVYHFANQGSCSWFEFARQIYRLSGADPHLVKPIESSLLNLKAIRPKFSKLSVDKWESSGLGRINSWQESIENIFPEILSEMKK